MSDDTKIVGLLTEIDMREKALSQSSDELREGMEKIFNQIGDPNWCRVCDRPFDPYHKLNIYTKDLDHEFTPKIRVSIDVCDSEILYSKSNRGSGSADCYLAIQQSHIVVLEKYFEDVYERDIQDLSRKHLGDIVRSGRIIPFLKLVAQELQKTGNEYREVAEIAKKMASAL